MTQKQGKLGPSTTSETMNRRADTFVNAFLRSGQREGLLPWTWQEEAYAVSLDAQRHNDFYYRTFSHYVGSGSHGRDIRTISRINPQRFTHVLKTLGQPYILVSEFSHIRCWGSTYGWAIIKASIFEELFQDFGKMHECVLSPTGLFWDTQLQRNRATSRRTTQFREQVLNRDRRRCVECGKTESHGAVLTLDHIIPYSRGGETTADNLVTLCKSCNEGFGNNYHAHLFAIAGLHHGWDPKLLDPSSLHSGTAQSYASSISSNIMVSRWMEKCLPKQLRESLVSKQ